MSYVTIFYIVQYGEVLDWFNDNYLLIQWKWEGKVSWKKSSRLKISVQFVWFSFEDMLSTFAHTYCSAFICFRRDSMFYIACWIFTYADFLYWGLLKLCKMCTVVKHFAEEVRGEIHSYIYYKVHSAWTIFGGLSCGLYGNFFFFHSLHWFEDVNFSLNLLHTGFCWDIDLH